MQFAIRPNSKPRTARMLSVITPVTRCHSGNTQKPNNGLPAANWAASGDWMYDIWSEKGSFHQADERTLAPANTAAAVFLASRSTAGNCFGRFIGVLHFDRISQIQAGSNFANIRTVPALSLIIWHQAKLVIQT